MKKFIIAMACLASSTASFAAPGGSQCDKNGTVIIRWFCGGR
ncbi:MAG TPA: hypothetical protein VFY95_08565 [Sphingomicrobium sp.]